MEERENDGSVQHTAEASGDVLLFNKPIGMTPLQVIRQFQEENPKYNNIKIGYAGRLDPMASGLLICLVGDQLKQQKHHELLQKEYLFEVLFGITTDSYDILGKVLSVNVSKIPITNGESLRAFLQNFQGVRSQKYPPFSSARVKGKPLLHWALQGPEVLKQIEPFIPTVQVEVKTLDCLRVYTLTTPQLEEAVTQRVEQSRRAGEFRQTAVLASWKDLVFTPSVLATQQWTVVQLRAAVTAGTYVRVLANDMGGLAWSIHRTQAGPYRVEQARSVEFKETTVVESDKNT